MQSLTVLGATGSIGCSTLDVVARHPDRYRVFALTGRERIELLAAQCCQFSPAFAVVGDAQAAARLQALLRERGVRTEVLFGVHALCQVAADSSVDVVMAAIVGAAGLQPTLAAARAGKRILLANKEALVMTGDVFMATVRAGNATVLPIDSEHNAVFQCLPPRAQSDAAQLDPDGVTRILLTASGGPFRTASLEKMQSVTPEEACAHPNWQMGRKISVDSATMMNKGLELIEAHYLFGLPEERIDVVVHPQSVIHSLVEYRDGSMLAQLGNPDMRTPIAHALAYPERIVSGVPSLDLAAIAKLEFEPPDLERFPCLRLAREALRGSGAGACVLNAANEIAVEAFLRGGIGFMQIAGVNAAVLDRFCDQPTPESLEEVLSLDARARELALGLLNEVSE
jgi:1-deoxy-D-xylulose-5-phosphate reductoisomerase